jgi:hypothetical protein
LSYTVKKYDFSSCFSALLGILHISIVYQSFIVLKFVNIHKSPLQYYVSLCPFVEVHDNFMYMYKNFDLKNPSPLPGPLSSKLDPVDL